MQWTVEAQQRDPDSILAFYKKLIAMRKQYGVIADGAISFLETGTDMVLAYRRTLGEQGLDVFCNLEEKEHPINLSGSEKPGKALQISDAKQIKLRFLPHIGKSLFQMLIRQFLHKRFLLYSGLFSLTSPHTPGRYKI